MSNKLVIPDIHLPAQHPAWLHFLVDIYNQYDCDSVVCIGDIVDHHCISFHDAHPEGPSAIEEYQRVFEVIDQMYRTFPDMDVCIGNHDNRPQRIANKYGIPDVYMRDLKTVWGTPNWNWDYSFEDEDVYYFHGSGGGKTPALNKANSMAMSVVMGHCHSVMGVHWGAGPKQRWFGMDTGCLIDVDALQFDYGKHMIKKPILGCGVVLDGVPNVIPLKCARGEKYHKSRF